MAGPQAFDPLASLQDARAEYMRGELTDVKYIAIVNIILEAEQFRNEEPSPELVAKAHQISARLGLDTA